ncbi:MAG: hydrogenase maturation protease [Nitrolancea sp.]
MSAADPSPRVLIIGLGNRYRQDDAVGLFVVRRLSATTDVRVQVVEHDGDPLDLLPIWSGSKLAIIVDALNLRQKAGMIYQFDPDADLPPNRESIVSSHGHSLWDAWELAKLLSQRPQRAMIFAIAGRQFGQGEGLSPEVEAAIEVVAKRVIEFVSSVA